MRIYYNRNTGKLLTEEEVHKEIDNVIDDWRFQILLERFTTSEAWDMLKEDARADLDKQVIQEILKEDYYYRDFSE